MELIDLISSVNIFQSQMTLLRWLTFLLRSLTVTLTDLHFWIYLFLLMVVFVLQWVSLHWKILIMLFSQFPLTNFCWFAYSILNKGKSAMPSLFKGLEVLFSASDKMKLFAKNISRNSNLDDSGYHFTCFLF